MSKPSRILLSIASHVIEMNDGGVKRAGMVEKSNVMRHGKPDQALRDLAPVVGGCEGRDLQVLADNLALDRGVYIWGRELDGGTEGARYGDLGMAQVRYMLGRAAAAAHSRAIHDLNRALVFRTDLRTLYLGASQSAVLIHGDPDMVLREASAALFGDLADKINRLSVSLIYDSKQSGWCLNRSSFAMNAARQTLSEAEEDLRPARACVLSGLPLREPSNRLETD